MQAAENEAKRRLLLNEIIHLKGNIRVFCRVRPPTNGARAAASVVDCHQDGASLSIQQGGKTHAFSYDKVFGPQASQEEVFAQVSELVQSALDGYKVCLFSYGQTGAGKTHTMQGNAKNPIHRVSYRPRPLRPSPDLTAPCPRPLRPFPDPTAPCPRPLRPSPDPSLQGIIPRAVEKILDGAARMESQGWQYTFEASFIEIYNETIRDLLAGKASRIDDKSAIKHDADGGHTVVQVRML